MRNWLLTLVIGNARASELSIQANASTVLALATSFLGFVAAALTLVFAWSVFDVTTKWVTAVSVLLFGSVWPLYRWVVPVWPTAERLANHFIPAAMYVACGFAAVYAAGGLPLASIYAPAIPLLSVMICGTRGAIAWSGLMALTFVAAIVFGPLATDLTPAPAWMSLAGGLTVLIPTLISMLIHRDMWTQSLRNERTLRRELAGQHARQRDLDKRLSEHERAESLSLMAGRVAHDLNNFLTSVSGNASLARDQLQTGKNQDAADSVAAIDQAAQVASELSRQLLNYSGKRHLTMADVNLGHRLDATLVLARAAIEGGVQINVRSRDTQDVWIHGDPTQIDQLIVNLVRNAAEAYTDDAAEKVVHVSINSVQLFSEHACALETVLPPGMYALFEVEDTGVGVPADVAAHIFEPFYSTKPEGKGLGLASVSGIVTAHGGGIEFKSWVRQSSAETKSGTTVSVYLPLQVPGSVKRSDVSLQNRWAASSSTTVLVADDQKEVRKVVGRLVEQARLDPEFAADGREALDKLAAADASFALAILDVSMPHLDGVSVLRSLREQGSDLPVLLISGYASADSSASVLSDQRALFLQKPFSAKAFADALQHLGVVPMGVAAGE